MKLFRMVVTAVAVCMMFAAIGAAPITKKPAATRVAPHVSTPPSDGSDVAKPEIELMAPSETDHSLPSDPLETGWQPLGQSVELPAGQAASGAPVNMDWYSINNGGAIEVAAGNIKMGLSIGQNAVGEVSAGNIKMGLGFWYGAAGSASPTCACDCAADPVCDSLTDIFDVTQLVNVAFRNAAPILDPNVLCPRATTDVNCDGVTDIFDVTRMVNVAFRNGDPATEFCDPCAPNL